MIPLITAQQVAFWVFAPIAVAGALGMVISRKPVHSALSLAGMMVALGCLYASLDAPFLFVAQIIVYTGAVMMLFLFTMMIVGVDTVDSLIETIRGQRVAAGLFVFALAALLIVAVGQGIVTTVGLAEANRDGNVEGLSSLIFGPFVLAFELTAALLITAAVAAIVLAHGERLRKKQNQADRVRRRTRAFAEDGIDPGPLPNPGVYARHNSIDYPALLPDGSVAETSISPTLAVRGVAVVENDGLRAAARAAITQFVEVSDEMQGTDMVGQIADELDDSARPELGAGESSEEIER